MVNDPTVNIWQPLQLALLLANTLLRQVAITWPLRDLNI
jgi:hypothetical protein